MSKHETIHHLACPKCRCDIGIMIDATELVAKTHKRTDSRFRLQQFDDCYAECSNCGFLGLLGNFIAITGEHQLTSKPQE